MSDFLADTGWYKRKSFVLLSFCCITLVMLISRYLGFYTFKGSDDLHYAFLSSRILNGSYDMFFARDIYEGRPVVIFYQALWFKLLGINDLSLALPSISVLVLLAYFVCFKSGLQKDVRTITLAAALIYFNPVVTRTTLGNLPDVYIALIALLVLLLIKKCIGNLSVKQNIQWAFIAGLLLIAGLFVKESIVLIYAGAAFMLFYYRSRLSRNFLIAISTTVLVGSAGYLLFYYLNTGNAFFHFVQIKNAAYFNPCSYGCLPGALLKRLTIIVPYEAVVSNAWPLLLVVPALFATRKNKNTGAGFWKISFVVLLLLAMYFPFSIDPYVPLCHDMRQFFFLFPFAVIFYVACISDGLSSEKFMNTINIATAIFFAVAALVCFAFTSFNKWSIFCTGLLTLAFIVNTIGNKKMQPVILFLLIPVLLWLSTAYTFFKKPHDGYAALKTISGIIKKDSSFNSGTFYFLNNDTKTHFALINQFDTSKQFINLDTIQKGFKPFIAYQPQPALSGPGWLVISEDYIENLDTNTLPSIKLLLAQQTGFYSTGKTTAYPINDMRILQRVINMINIQKAGDGCY